MYIQITDNMTGVTEIHDVSVLRRDRDSVKVWWKDEGEDNFMWMPEPGTGRVSSRWATFELLDMHPVDEVYLKVYPKFIEAVVNQLRIRQADMESDLDPQERVPFVNFVDTIGRHHFETLVEEMVEDAVELAERLT